MVPVWMTFSDLQNNPDFKVTIIQRQITQKWYNNTYNGRPIESRIWPIEPRHFQWAWTTLTPGFKVTPFFDAEYLRNGMIYTVSKTSQVWLAVALTHIHKSTIFITFGTRNQQTHKNWLQE